MREKVRFWMFAVSEAFLCDAMRKLTSGKRLATISISLHWLCHGYRMIHYRIIQVALLVEGNAFRLCVALLIGRADADCMFSGLRLPVKVPANPSGRDVRLPEPRPLPVSLVQTVLYFRDLTGGRPAPTANQPALRADFSIPGEFQRAL